LVTKQLRIDSRNPIIFSRSPAAAVAAEMASLFESRALILETLFTSIKDMAKAVFPALPIGPLVRTRNNVAKRRAELKLRCSLCFEADKNPRIFAQSAASAITTPSSLAATLIFSGFGALSKQ
jgi:hypothetical protein